MLGDDTPVGWTLTIAYAIGAAITIGSGLRIVGAQRGFVVASGLGLVLLGVNKQLDLQSLVFAAGRRVTFALDLYESRDALHVLFPMLVGGVLLAAFVLVVWRMRGGVRVVAPMLAGWALLALYVVVRVALFSHLARVLGWTWLERDEIALLELAGVAVIALGALRVARTAR